MDFEDRIREAVEARSKRLQTEVDAHMHGLQAELMSAWDTTRADIERRAKEEAQAEVAAIRADLEREKMQQAERLAAAEARVEERVSEVRATAARQRVEADAELVAFEKRAEERLAAVRGESERRLADALATAATEANARLEAALGQLRVEHAHALATLQPVDADDEQRLTEVRAHERHAQLAATERLLAAVRAIDQSDSLSDVLTVLASGASAETARVAVLVVSGARARGWRATGFHAPAESIDLSLSDAGIVGEAVTRRACCLTHTADTGQPRASAPGFAGLVSGHVGLAVPIEVGGQVVAIVYADDSSALEPAAPAAWPEAIEVLARHAAARLEALTARRTAQALGVGASAGAHPPSAKPPAPPPVAPPAPAEDEGARRYAKLLVSEIKLYNEAAVRVGRQKRDLLERLRHDIERARRLYEDRLTPDARARSSYIFEDELVQTLADGDPSLLGKAAV